MRERGAFGSTSGSTGRGGHRSLWEERETFNVGEASAMGEKEGSVGKIFSSLDFAARVWIGVGRLRH